MMDKKPVSQYQEIKKVGQKKISSAMGSKNFKF
jgi:hypothetical protein